MSEFFTFPHPINSTVARLVAGGVVIMTALAIGLDQPWLIVAVAYGFIARVAAGPRMSPLAQLSLRVVIPLFDLPYRPVPGPPKRFAATIGVVFSVTALVLYFGAGLHGAAFGVLGALIFAAGLESLLGFCLGCQVFAVLMRTGVIPESVCEQCADWDTHAARLQTQAGG